MRWKRDWERREGGKRRDGDGRCDGMEAKGTDGVGSEGE